MTTQPYISAHEDPEGRSPWAMQCVVNENTEFSDLELAHALAVAVANFLDRTRHNTEWAKAVDTWKEGRIRKIIRRAKNARWDKVQDEEGLTTTHNGITIRVFVPCAMDEIPANIKKCQVSGIKTDKPREYRTIPETGSYLMIFLNESLNMTAGKSAVAAAHVAHLMAEKLTEEDYAVWSNNGFPLAVSTLTSVGDWLEDYAAVTIHDGGLTEVEPGSITAIGFWVER